MFVVENVVEFHVFCIKHSDDVAFISDKNEPFVEVHTGYRGMPVGVHFFSDTCKRMHRNWKEVLV